MITGIICFLIMRSLGELLLSNLNYHSFVDFVQDYLGDMAAFITGWTYWFCWISIAMADLTAVALHSILAPGCAAMGARLNRSDYITDYELGNRQAFWRIRILVCVN